MAKMLTTPPRNNQINTGPFNAYAQSHAILLLQVSDFVRFNTSLPPRLSEFAIMIAARQWSQLYEWRAHHPLAIKGGLIDRFWSTSAPATGRKACRTTRRRSMIIARNCTATGTFSDATFKAAVTHFGERGVMDVIGIIGYYDLSPWPHHAKGHWQTR